LRKSLFRLAGKGAAGFLVALAVWFGLSTPFALGWWRRFSSPLAILRLRQRRRHGHLFRVQDDFADDRREA
jgi:hypothetical protein